MDDLIVLLVWLVIIFGAVIGNVLKKLGGSASTMRKLAQAGKRSKSLLEMLTGEEDRSLLDLLKPKEGSEGENIPEVAEPPQPAAEVRTQVLERPTQPVVVPPPMRRPEPVMRPVPEAREPVRIRRKLTAVAQPVFAEEELPPPPPPPRPMPKARPAPARTAVPTVAEILASLRSGTAAGLQEAILLREILGPPKAMTIMSRTSAFPWEGFPRKNAGSR